MNIFKRRVALAMLLSCAFGSAHADVVISQVYGGGGNTGAPYNRDFVELHNNGSTSVSLSGWSVQYASASGNTWQVTALSGSIAPGAYYLVQQGSGANGSPLPTADATGTIAMSGTAGKVALSAATTALTGTCPTGNVDFVGFGTTANCAEGGANTPAPSNTTSVIRANGGCTDTNNNAADFAPAAPNPRNSATTAFNCGPTPPVISIADQARREGNGMQQWEAFTVQLSQPAGPGGVTYHYTLTPGTAAQGSDYTLFSQSSYTIPEGQSTGVIVTSFVTDTVIEGDETFTVTLHTISGALAGDVSGVITILDDDAPPQISISDAATTEGDSGTKQLTFTVSLSSPVPQGGLTYRYSTADATAVAGSDFVAASDLPAFIGEGLTTANISITVTGDGAIEGDETFFLNLSNAVGGTISDGQGVGTISNDDFPITPIHDIQGSGPSSLLDGQVLYTRGIVTGRKSNGFFIQAADVEADADPMTSEGIYVFTSTAPPAAAAVGNLVRVAATVDEYVPSADPGQAPLTELTFATVTQLSTGNPLPTAVALTTTFPDPAGALDQLERLEGMRVTAASFSVVAATGGFTDETNATGSSNGIFNVVVTGVPRPFREPGIQAPDLPPSGSIPPIPRWDFNPELLTVDSDALGALVQNLSTGATITGLTGPLDFGFRRYTVLAEATPVVTGGLAPTPARVQTADEFTVAGYNLERFFDTVNDPGIGEPVLSAPAFANRLNKASLAIRNYLNAPDIIGVVEIENLSTLQSVAAKVNSDAVAAGQPDPQYLAYLEEGNDVGGIDVGFLVKTADAGAGIARVEVKAVVQHGKSTTWVEPDSSTSLLNDRPPLLLDAVVHYADGRTFPITVIVVHQRSLNGAEEATASGDRIRAKRQEQAEFLATLIAGMQAADPLQRITVLGDFNAFEFNDGYVDAMHVVEGIPVPDEETVVPGDGIDLVNPDLLNLAALEDAGQRYSFVFDGNAQSLDHVLVNQVLGADVDSIDLDHARINADFPETNRNDVNSPSRLADHDPAVAYFQVPALQFANLATTASAPATSVSVGNTMTFDATVTNNGPDAAEFVGVGFALDAEVLDLAVAAPDGWACDTPVVAAGTTTVACNIPELVNGAPSQAFQLTGTAPASAVDSAINLIVLADADTVDPDEADNDANASVDVVAASADIQIAISGPTRTATHASYTVSVRNAGPDSVPTATLELDTNIPESVVTFSGGPTPWTCNGPSATSFRRTCLYVSSIEMPAGSTGSFVVTVPRTHVKNSYFILGTASSPEPDPNGANNVARRRLAMPQP